MCLTPGGLLVTGHKKWQHNGAEGDSKSCDAVGGHLVLKKKKKSHRFLPFRQVEPVRTEPIHAGSAARIMF